MKRIFYFFFTAAILMCASCSKYTQIFQTKPATPGITSGDLLYFENDTVKITYSFWHKNGTLAFSIYNKLNIPIYIDWKKSSLVKDGQKFNYWSEETITKKINKRADRFYMSYGDYELLGVSSGSSEGISHSRKPERITFLAPHSNLIKIKFALYPFTDDKLNNNAIAGSMDNPISKKPVAITYKEFKESNSPLSFRNFLTISTSEKFENEVYIDNGFYVSRISQMKKDNFSGKELYDKGSNKMVYEMPFRSAALFFIDVK
ncbi:MAG TPA: hypothetical protein VNS58_25685 [Puia sp.]|nr:hypothetical protein [Puia sp.]